MDIRNPHRADPLYDDIKFGDIGIVVLNHIMATLPFFKFKALTNFLQVFLAHGLSLLEKLNIFYQLTQFFKVALRSIFRGLL